MILSPKIALLLLIAFSLSLGSCVNEVKNPPKAQDTLARLVIKYNIPDSNNILALDFNALLTPPWKPQYRIDWNFGDSTGTISKFDTSMLAHSFKTFGLYTVSLKIIDTVTKAIIGKTSVVLDLTNNAIDTNYLHGFTSVQILFSGYRKYDDRIDTTRLTMGDFYFYKKNMIRVIPNITWIKNHFELMISSSWNYVDSSQNPPNGNIYDNGSERNSFSGDVSYSGDKIDLGSFHYNYEENATSQHFTWIYYRETILNYQSIPIIKKGNNSIVFSFNDSKLQSLIPLFRDSTNTSEVYGSHLSYSHQLQNIFWEHSPTPTLTITFSK